MNEVKEFLKILNTDPKTRELLRQTKEATSAEEAADQYVIIAKKLGMNLPKDQILTFLKNEEKFQKQRTSSADKVVLSENEMNVVAGGTGPEIFDDQYEADTVGFCASSFKRGEWCWFSDSCSTLINFYDKEEGLPYEDYHCSTGMLKMDGDNLSCPENVFFKDASGKDL